MRLLASELEVVALTENLIASTEAFTTKAVARDIFFRVG